MKDETLHGVVAEFESAEQVLAAARAAYAAGYRAMDAYTPYPVEDLAEALGVTKTRVSLITLICALSGSVTGYLLQYFSAVWDYPINVGGRPLHSWPSFIPITFELTVLFGAIGGVIGMLVLNGLPRHHHPIFETPHFEQRNASHFYLCVEASDPLFEKGKVRALLESTKPTEIWEILGIMSPFVQFGLALMAVMLTACRQDMNDQARYGPLKPGDFFKDGAASRPLPDHTVARGKLHEDTVFYTGRVNAKEFTAMLPMPLTPELLRRGEERFSIYCSVCHGRTGNGDGMIVQRGFPHPPAYSTDRLRAAPVGYFYEVITHGYGVMYSYAARVEPADRWAIAAYIRVLQLSQHAALADADAAPRQQLETAP